MLRRDARLDIHVREQGPARPILAPHPTPPTRPPSTENHAPKANTTASSADFFSSLLGVTQLKNIAELARVYSLQVGLPARAKPTELSDIKFASLPAAAVAPIEPSIAVLPFANMSGDAEQEYFADGISEDIITALSKLPQLLVIARNSAFTFKGKNVHVPEVGKILGVRYVLEGSVRESAPGSGSPPAHRRDDRWASMVRTLRP